MKRLAPFVVGGLVLVSCSTPDARRADHQELLRLQEIERRAHLTYDASLLASYLADTVATLRTGEVHMQTQEEVLDQLRAYFEASTFLEWSDIEPPAVEVAASGELATVRAHRRVRLGVVDSAGRTVPEHTVFSWIETWRDEGEGWRLAGTATTDRPGRRDLAGAERRAELRPAGLAPSEVLERARAAAVTSPGASADVLRSIEFTASGNGPRGPFRTSVRSDRTGAIDFRQTTSGGRYVRFSVGPLVEADADSADALRALLQGHALLHLVVEPGATLGLPESSGSMTFAGRGAHVVRFRDGAGHPLELIYDSGSARLVGARIRDPEDPGEVVLLYLSGWQEVEDFLLPLRAVFQQGEELYLYRIDRVNLQAAP